MPTTKPKRKAAIIVAMKIPLNLKNDKKKYIIFPRALQFRNKIIFFKYITKHTFCHIQMLDNQNLL